MNLRILASAACLAVIAASGTVIWRYAGGTGAAQAQGDEVTRADLCRIARDAFISHKYGFSELDATSSATIDLQIQMCQGEEEWPAPPFPQ